MDCGHSQSHQAGIETTWEFCQIEFTCYSQSHQAGIETFGFCNFFFGFNPSPNRTKLELKLVAKADFIDRVFSQSHQAGIETQQRPIDGMVWQILPIAPSWNWNSGNLHCSNNPFVTPNRTKLELKHWPSGCQFLWPGPPNRTKLELKHVTVGYCKTAGNSQSHQAGIETTNVLSGKG
mgnify:CR=1 FL=1